MRNCLVTKLKETVVSDNLYKLNEVRMLVPVGNTMRLDASYRASGETFTITPISGSFTVGGTTYNPGQTFTADTTTNYSITFSSTEDTLLSFGNKQALKYIEMGGDRVSALSGKHRMILNPDLGYMENLWKMEAYMAYDCDSFTKCPNLIWLGTGNFYQKMKSSVFRNYINHDNFPVLEKLVCAVEDPIEQVDISVFASLITLTLLQNSMDKGFVGEINTLAEKMVSAGRTSGTLELRVANTVTYNGEACDNTKTYTITFDSSLQGGYSVAVS